MGKTNNPMMVVVMFISMMMISSSSSSSSSTAAQVCSLTPHPDLCNSLLLLLPPFEKPRALSSSSSSSSNDHLLHDLAALSLSHSLSNAQTFLDLLRRYYLTTSSSSFHHHRHHHRALEDCLLLSGLNVDLLSQVSQLAVTTRAVAAPDDLLTWLSTTITNQQTCLEALIDLQQQHKHTLTFPLPPHHLPNHLNMLFSLSLALVKHAWPPLPKHHHHHHHHSIWLSKHSSATTSLGSLKVNVRGTVRVNSEGTGDYTRIQDAVDAAPPHNNRGDGYYYVIHVQGGVYNEYVSIPNTKPYIMMIGDGINRTVITGHRSVVDGWTTFNSPTFAVVGKGFVAMNITFRNTAGAGKHQAVAVRNGADKSAFYSCSFEGYQDTLYAHSQRQFYKNCDIYGTVDYIFGNAAAVFQDCNIYSRLPMDSQFNTITAQGRTDPNQNTGFSIQNCALLAATTTTVKSKRTYLGRPWKEYSRTIVMDSFLDSLIHPSGWAPWNASAFALDTLYYAEFNNNGPGSSTRHRVNWSGYHVVDATVANNFTVSNFLAANSWLSFTGVPYTSGLN